MEDLEIIRHKRRFDIFKQLQNDKTLIKMVVLGRQYERLTVVTGTRFKKSQEKILNELIFSFQRDALRKKMVIE